MQTDKTILVVEDERPLAEAIRINLEDSGFEVVTARTVDQALDYCKSVKNIGAIWLDHYLLGKKDGLDFVASIKSEDMKLYDIPIFVVSNTAGPEKMLSYMHLGVEKYYIKAEHHLADIIKDITKTIAAQATI
jgi:two-component system response regulator VicR